ncbi:MAG: amino acid adenylation domain-containing protein, partial [Burkholderiales bacterium]|nr:amino acid adenylation domain-containing protein [Burkholderiales bacterium]
MYKIPLSPYHKIFYNEWQINPYGNNYHLISDQFLYGNLCVDMVRIAVKKFIHGYILFNSRVEIIEEEPFWVKSAYTGELKFFENPLSDTLLFQEVNKPFNLNNGELHRFFLIKYSSTQYRFIASCHHILASGSSAENGVFINLINYYNDNTFQIKYGLDEQVPLLSSLNAKLNELVANNLGQAKQFWQNKLNNLEAIDLRFLCLGSDKVVDDNIMQFFSKELCFNFSKEILNQTHNISRKYKITPYFLGQMILAYLFYRHTGQKRVGISYPMSIREGRDFIYGSQMNTSIVVYDFEHIIYFTDLVKQVKQFIDDVKNHRKFDYRYCPVSEIIDINNKNLLDVAFAQTNLKYTPFKFSDIESVKINDDFNGDLTNILIFEQELRDHKVNFRIKYNSVTIDTNLLTNFVNCYQRLYKEILQDENKNSVNKALKDYSILAAKDYNKIVYEWNNTFSPYPENKMIHQLFEEQVTKTPNNIAVVYKNKQVTYKELNQKSNQLAHYLKNCYQINGDDLIVLCIDRSEYMIVAILAVLKSGGAYVPLDSSYPVDRIRYILEDVKSKVVLTNEMYYDKLIPIIQAQEGIRVKSLHQNILALDNNEFIQTLDKQLTTNLTTATTNSSNLAYVIYTSGTTGKPNGVMIEHKNLTSFISGFINFPLNHEIPLNMLSTTNYVFDIFGLEYALPLINGYTVYLVDLLNYNHKLSLNNYNYIQITPSKLELLVDVIDYEVQASVSTIKHKVTILIGGEAFTKPILYKLRELNNMLNNRNIYLEIINVYGPTETTIWSSAGRIAINNDDNNINIGRPLNNQSIYILDQNLNIVPIGAIGEIYIGGTGLARSYLNSSELTKNKFISNPFPTNTGGVISPRLYKTGDLARYLPDGRLEYIGRSDNQVKIRGHRIELSEIETALVGYPTIKQAVVLFKESTACSKKNVLPRYLIAYYVAKYKLDGKAVLEKLNQQLPKYMIPDIL